MKAIIASAMLFGMVSGTSVAQPTEALSVQPSIQVPVVEAWKNGKYIGQNKVIVCSSPQDSSNCRTLQIKVDPSVKTLKRLI
jgi:hypothetical protein